MFLRQSGVPKFPREMFISRVKVESEKEYLWWLSRYNGQMDCFVSVYSLPQFEQGVVDTVFLDLDADTISEAKEKLNKVVERLDELELVYRVYFTGGRGFHVYIDCPPVKLYYPNFSIRRFVEKEIPAVYDPVVVGDMRRLARVPYTMHYKTKLFSFRVNPSLSTRSLIELPEELPYGMNPELAEWLMEEDVKGKERQLPLKEATQMVKSGWKGPAPPCIIDLLTRLMKEHTLTHQARLHLSGFLIQAGQDLKIVDDLLRAYADDYDEWDTKYQIQKLEAAKFKCYTCKNAKFHGLCPIADNQKTCIYYPSINVTLMRYEGGIV